MGDCSHEIGKALRLSSFHVHCHRQRQPMRWRNWARWIGIDHGNGNPGLSIFPDQTHFSSSGPYLIVCSFCNWSAITVGCNLCTWSMYRLGKIIFLSFKRINILSLDQYLQFVELSSANGDSAVESAPLGF